MRLCSDDIDAATKSRRLREVYAAFAEGLASRNAAAVGTVQCVLVDRLSMRSASDLAGHADSHKRIVFPKRPIPSALGTGASAAAAELVTPSIGEFVAVRIVRISGGTLVGEPIACTTLPAFRAAYRTGQSASAPQAPANRIAAVIADAVASAKAKLHGDSARASNAMAGAGAGTRTGTGTGTGAGAGAGVTLMAASAEAVTSAQTDAAAAAAAVVTSANTATASAAAHTAAADVGFADGGAA
jgi:hypothetical protein